MPRRSAAKQEEDPNIEKRVTRRSLRGATEKETPKKQTPVKKAPSPSPRGRGRGRGRPSSRGAARAAEEEPEKQEPEDVEDEESKPGEESMPEKESPAATPKAGRGRGRSRGRPAKAAVEEEEKEGEKDVEESPSSRRRGVRGTPKKETPTPPRRGRRGRSSGAGDEEEEERAEEEKPETATEKSEEKEEEKMEVSEEEPKTEAKKRKHDDVEEDKEEASVEVAEKKAKLEEPTKGEEKVSEPGESKPEDMETEKEAEEPTKIDEKKEETKPSEKPAEAPAPPPVPKVTSDESPKKTEDKQEKKQESPKIAKPTEPPAPASEPVKPSAPPAEEAPAEEPLKDYVVINMEDVPPTDSIEVTRSLPTTPTEPSKQGDLPKVTPAPTVASPEKTAPTPPAAPAPPTPPVPVPSTPPAPVPSTPPAPVPSTPPAPVPSTPPAPVPSTPPAPAPSAPAPVAVPVQQVQQTSPTSIPQQMPHGLPQQVVHQPASMPQQPQAQAPPASEQRAPMHPAPGSVSQAPLVSNSMPEINSTIRNGTIGNSVQSDTDALFGRKTVRNPHLFAPVPPERAFTLVSYNILADCHALHNSNQYNWISPEKLSMRMRQARLLQELRYLNADILCLQEVSPDFFQNILTPTLKGLGYEGVFKKRLSDNNDEGSATFYRTARFTLLTHRGLSLTELAFKELEASGLDTARASAVRTNIARPTVVLNTQLRCNNTGQVITVGNIHVGWDHLNRPDLQCIQAACAVKEVVAMGDGPGNAHVLCGDFNSTPDSSVYQLMRDGYLNDTSVAALQALKSVSLPDGQSQALVNLWWKGFQHTSPNMRSTYGHVTGNEPVTTRYVNIAQCRRADYIWCGGSNLDVTNVLAAVPEQLISSGIPNDIFPSDHLSLKTELFFK